MKCKHKDAPVIIGVEHPFGEDWLPAYNYGEDGETRQRITHWCPKCGALKINGKWQSPDQTGVHHSSDNLKISKEKEE